MSEVAVVGGGIVGLATARALAEQGHAVTVLEREAELATHQSGRNSGVVHAGVYYPPGSLKAELCRRGVDLLRAYCDEHALPWAEHGKVVVAVSHDELPRLRDLESRARAAGVPGLARLTPAELADIEPHIAGVAALHSPTTAVTDFAAVSKQLATELQRTGGRVRRSTAVARVTTAGTGARVEFARGAHETYERVVVCAGLWSAQLAARSGAAREPRIVPFRGEFFELSPQRAEQINGLVYPVPDPALPFLGVHFTRGVDGRVMLGPTAVPAFALAGYRRRDIDPRTLAELAWWPGARRLARRHWRHGARELAGSLRPSRVARDAARYLPGLTRGDLSPARSGVRAQAVGNDGGLVDDFLLEQVGPVTWVRNAPSPAATSSLAIAERIAGSLR